MVMKEYSLFKNRCPVQKIERRSLDRKGTWDGLKCAITLVITVGMLSAMYSFVQFKISLLFCFCSILNINQVIHPL